MQLRVCDGGCLSPGADALLVGSPGVDVGLAPRPRLVVVGQVVHYIDAAGGLGAPGDEDPGRPSPPLAARR